MALCAGQPARSVHRPFSYLLSLEESVQIEQALAIPRGRFLRSEKGDKYYGRELFDEKDDSKSFAIEPRKQIVRLEIYKINEAITLGVLLRDDIPGAFELSPKAGNSSGAGFSIRRGYFVTRIYRGGMRHKLRFLSQPQAQLFYALTNRRSVMESNDSDFLSDYLRVHVGAAPSWVALPKRNPNEPRLLRAGTGHEGGYAYLEVGFANVNSPRLRADARIMRRADWNPEPRSSGDTARLEEISAAPMSITDCSPVTQPLQ